MSEPWFSPDGVAVATTIVGVAGGVAGAYLRLIDQAQETRIKAQDDKIKELKDGLEALERDRGHRTRESDKRIAEIERTYISRTDHAEFRMEMLAAIEKLGSKIDHFMDRLSKVEAGK